MQSSVGAIFPGQKTTYQRFSVEDYQDGYPRFAALLAAHAPFLILRRFNRVRARLLLQKQYQVSLLEEKLDKIDQSEPCVVFLGTCQLDANTDRLRTLSELDVGLRDYGK